MPVQIDSRRYSLFTRAPFNTLHRIARDEAPAYLTQHAWVTMSADPRAYRAEWWTVGSFTYQGTRTPLAVRCITYQGRTMLLYAISRTVPRG